MMKSFIAVLLLLLITVLWLITNPIGTSPGPSDTADNTQEQTGVVDRTTTQSAAQVTKHSTTSIHTTTDKDVSRRTGNRQTSDELQLSTMEAFQTAADLATPKTFTIDIKF